MKKLKERVKLTTVQKRRLLALAVFSEASLNDVLAAALEEQWSHFEGETVSFLQEDEDLWRIFTGMMYDVAQVPDEDVVKMMSDVREMHVEIFGDECETCEQSAESDKKEKSTLN